MPRLLLYTDLSARCGSTFTTLAGQRLLFERRGLYTPLLLLRMLTRPVEEGRNILLYGGAVWPVLHRNLLDHLRQMPQMRRYQIHMLFTLGRPACRLEQDIRGMRYRLGAMPSLPAMMALVRRRYLVADLLELARRECGAEHVDVLVDSSDSCVDKGDPELLGKVFGHLGCPPPESSAPCTIEGIASQRNAHFANLLCVQGNQWPPIQESSLIQCLQRQEANLSFDPWLTSPPAVRARHADLVLRTRGKLRQARQTIFLELKRLGAGLSSRKIVCRAWRSLPRVLSTRSACLAPCTRRCHVRHVHR